MLPFDSTIAALSTPPGKGGVALIRVSGKDAVAVADACFRAKNGKPLTEAPARRAIYGDLLYEGENIDDVLVTVFRAPHSYTGEDTVEITCHGGMLLCQTILSSLFAAGARPAERGEFTRRAFVAGKLGLSEAEAIAGVLDAGSVEELKLFRRDSRSQLSQALGALYDDLATLISTVYAKIDYPDEDLADLSDDEIRQKAAEIRARVGELLATYRTGHAIAEGIPTVLLGKPNTGKSSLYNRLLGRDAAIVTDVAGTTRDVLEATVSTGRVTLRLADTAGVRPTDDPVEKIGVDRSKSTAAAAELLLVLFDASREADGEDRALIEFTDTLPGEKIALCNKSDLPARFDTSLLSSHFSHILPLNARKGDLSALYAKIDGLFTDGKIKVGTDVILSSARQKAALERAADRLDTAIAALACGVETDAAVSDLELALGEMAEIDGRAVSEEIVNGIFSKFCVGK